MTIGEILSDPKIAALVGGVSMTSVKYVADVLISSLEAPTKDSTPKYRYWFRVANKFAANWERARDTSIERSPNWTDATNLLPASKNPIPPASGG